MLRVWLLVLASLFSASLAAELLNWVPPEERVNGQKMKLEEVGGYELQGFNKAGEQIWGTVIEDGRQTTTEAPEAAFYLIAAYDTDGLYSDFVIIKPVIEEAPLPAPIKVEVY